jgi:hypothetical protein
MNLIAGPGVYICDECVGLCNEILDDALSAAPSIEPTERADCGVGKWTGWIEGAIKSNVAAMHLRRDAWSDVSEILHDNKQLPNSYWWRFMADTYTVTQAVAVRRQAAAHRDVASLARLMSEIGDDASTLTRARWTDLRRERNDASGRIDPQSDWDTHFAGAVGRHLDPAIAQADLEKLRSAATELRDDVGDRIAHADASAVPTSVTLAAQKVDEVIDLVGGLFERYHRLLTASSSTLPLQSERVARMAARAATGRCAV